jgi:uncharacterized protein (TIGR02145 family)
VAAGYVGHCRTNTQPGAGYLYNWPAVMQNRNAYSGSTDSSFACSGTGSGTVSPNPASCRGICPEGWHIPTRRSWFSFIAGEFDDLHDCLSVEFEYFKNGYGYEIVDNVPNHWHGVLGGLCSRDGTLFEQHSAYYWSSTYYDAWLAAYHTAGNSFTYPYDDAPEKHIGRSVRCVRNY